MTALCDMFSGDGWMVQCRSLVEDAGNSVSAVRGIGDRDSVVRRRVCSFTESEGKNMVRRLIR